MNVLKPAYFYASVSDIPLERLAAEQPRLRGLSWDLDGTLAEHLGDSVADEHLQVIATADQLGLVQAIISNAHSEHRAERVRRAAAGILDRTGVELAVVVSRDVNARKPKPVIFRTAAGGLGLEPSEMIHTGDQIARDIVGPNLAGFIGGILVAPYGGTADESWAVRRLQRPVERAVRTVMNIPFRDADFPRS